MRRMGHVDSTWHIANIKFWLEIVKEGFRVRKVEVDGNTELILNKQV
jgi:hypothetical protein